MGRVIAFEVTPEFLKSAKILANHSNHALSDEEEKKFSSI